MGGLNNVEASRSCDREPRHRSGIEVVLGLSVFALALYGLIAFCIHVSAYFRGETEELLMPDPAPTMNMGVFDFSDMEQTLKGIERQLERMNNIEHLRIQAEKGGDEAWEK